MPQQQLQLIKFIQIRAFLQLPLQILIFSWLHLVQSNCKDKNYKDPTLSSLTIIFEKIIINFINFKLYFI